MTSDELVFDEVYINSSGHFSYLRQKTAYSAVFYYMYYSSSLELFLPHIHAVSIKGTEVVQNSIYSSVSRLES